MFVSLVQHNGESYVEGELNYFNVYNMTDLLQTDIINEKYKKDFAAVYNISFTSLVFRTKLIGDTVMRWDNLQLIRYDRVRYFDKYTLFKLNYSMRFCSIYRLCCLGNFKNQYLQPSLYPELCRCNIPFDGNEKFEYKK